MFTAYLFVRYDIDVNELESHKVASKKTLWKIDTGILPSMKTVVKVANYVCSKIPNQNDEELVLTLFEMAYKTYRLQEKRGEM